ncbi:MAG TPA: YjhX family toxin [Caulobacteraceae bacterium]
MNISKSEQRTLHALAQGGRILIVRDDRGALTDAECVTREGWRLTDCSLVVFQKLRRRRLVMSRNSGPYRITREGLLCLRAQADNRVSGRSL